MSDNKPQQASDAFMQIMDTVVDLMTDINASESANYNNSRADNQMQCITRVNNPYQAEYTPVTPIENNAGMHPVNMHPAPMGNQMPVGMPQMTVVQTHYGPMLVPVGGMPHMGMVNPGVMGGYLPPMMSMHPGMINPMIGHHQPMPLMQLQQMRQNAGDVTYLSQNSMHQIHETLRHIDELQGMINSVKIRFGAAVNSGGAVPNITGVGIITEGTVEDITNAMSGLYNLLKHGAMTYR